MVESVIAEVFHAGRNGDFLQLVAVMKGITADSDNTLGNGDFGNEGSVESAGANVFQALGQLNRG